MLVLTPVLCIANMYQATVSASFASEPHENAPCADAKHRAVLQTCAKYLVASMAMLASCAQQQHAPWPAQALTVCLEVRSLDVLTPFISALVRKCVNFQHLDNLTC